MSNRIKSITNLKRKESEQKIRNVYKYLNVPDTLADLLIEKYRDDIRQLYSVATPETLSKWMLKQYWYEQHPTKRRIKKESSSYRMMLH